MKILRKIWLTYLARIRFLFTGKMELGSAKNDLPPEIQEIDEQFPLNFYETLDIPDGAAGAKVNGTPGQNPDISFYFDEERQYNDLEAYLEAVKESQGIKYLLQRNDGENYLIADFDGAANILITYSECGQRAANFTKGNEAKIGTRDIYHLNHFEYFHDGIWYIMKFENKQKV